MNTRRDVTALENALPFNKSSARERLSKDIIKAVKNAQTLIDENEPTTAIFSKLCKKVGVYYAFNQRNKEIALRYLEKFKALVVEQNLQEEIADAYNLIGFASALDTQYNKVQPFEQALQIYAAFNQKNPAEFRLEEGFALRHIALMLYRQEKLEEAIEKVKEAIETQKQHTKTPSLKLIEIAESLHVFGNILAKQEKYTEAEKKYMQAKALWEEYKNTGLSAHPAKFSMLQSLSNTQMQLNKNNQAFFTLEQTYAEQLAYFADIEDHPDITRTLNLIEIAKTKIGLEKNKKMDTAGSHSISFFSKSDTPKTAVSAASSATPGVRF